jgi:hypothetical protein
LFRDVDSSLRYDGLNVKPSSIQPVTPPIIIFNPQAEPSESTRPRDKAGGERNPCKLLRRGIMEGNQDYRRLAAECLRIAETTPSPTDRAMLIRMAQIWHRMAEEKSRTEPHLKH